MKRWQYGIAETGENGQLHPDVTPCDTEAEAREIVAEQWPEVLLYKRPEPRPWMLVPYTPRDRS